MGANRWSARQSANVRAWSVHIADLSADALADAGLVSRDDVERAAAVIAEEVFVRLCLLDYPPIEETDRPPADT